MSLRGLLPVKGVFRQVTGNGTVPAAGDVTGTITVAARSVDTKNKMRDHLHRRRPYRSRLRSDKTDHLDADYRHDPDLGQTEQPNAHVDALARLPQPQRASVAGAGPSASHVPAAHRQATSVTQLAGRITPHAEISMLRRYAADGEQCAQSPRCLRCQGARTASTHARTRSASRSAQITQLGRARLESGRRPPAMQIGGYLKSSGDNAW
jgi:hypothetical protein